MLAYGKKSILGPLVHQLNTQLQTGSCVMEMQIGLQQSQVRPVHVYGKAPLHSLLIEVMLQHGHHIGTGPLHLIMRLSIQQVNP